MKYILMILIILVFSGCELFEDSIAKQEKVQILELKKLNVEQDKAMAEIELQKSLATIEKDKLIELQKMKNDVKAQELSSNSEAKLELIKQKVLLQDSNNVLSFQMYLMIFLAFVITVISGFVFYYLKRKRENELRAYEDNLKKYFYNKENDARMQIASKILDTIKENDLSKENENKLINAFAKDQRDYDEDAVIVTEALEHKDKDDV